MKRRTFLKIAGLGSISLGGYSPIPEKHLHALLNAIEDGVTGKATWYASTCRECPAGCGIMAKNREGRVIKIEGNPLHPVNRGKLCIRGHAALQGVYSPERLKTPLLKEDGIFRPISYEKASALLSQKARAAASDGPNRVRMITETVGQPLLTIFNRFLKGWKSGAALVFEPFAYESLKTANKMVFGIGGLPGFRIAKADVLVSFGADFLETWLSPVEYARQFKKMHALTKGKKGTFVHVSPYRSLTGANADLWVSCQPGTEAVIALGLIRQMVGSAEKSVYPQGVLEQLEKISSPYDKETVVNLSGISPSQYDFLINSVRRAGSPLILGTGEGTLGAHRLQADMAAGLLNLLLDPGLERIDFKKRHRVEIAAGRAEVIRYFSAMSQEPVKLLLIHRSNPALHLSNHPAVLSALRKNEIFKVCFSEVMDETAGYANLVFPPGHFLETWDEYAGQRGIVAMVQPTMANLYNAPGIGDVFLKAAKRESGGTADMKAYLYTHFKERGQVPDRTGWVAALGRGGVFESGAVSNSKPDVPASRVNDKSIEAAFRELPKSPPAGNVFAAVPGIRFFDGRGGDRSWLSEIPDPITKVAWQNPVLANPDTMAVNGIRHGEVVRMATENGETLAPVYEAPTVCRGVFIASLIKENGRQKMDRNAGHPWALLSSKTMPVSGGPRCDAILASIKGTGRVIQFAHTDGSRTQLDRKIALKTTPAMISSQDGDGAHAGSAGLAMDEFPLTLPLPEGYDPKRDFYPPHDHDGYRWSMVVDLDRCIGCGACAAACYAENNIGVVGEERILEGREMSWMRIERYHDPDRPEDLIFFPMMCQHCDNAPCESVCPVYAPHHSREGLNNQIYNRCIGTRFCSQNCPYKVRRFNWFDWKWEGPLKLQLNPEVTVRSKGVMEKCSFCVQRIKQAHGRAKDENRKIKDGEVVPACVQTCPTGALTFGNLMDTDSRVRRLADDPRAYQAMGYLNTKPAVIYLKKVVREI